MLAIIVAVAVIFFALGVVATILYLVYYAKTVEEVNEEFEESLSKGEKIK